MSMTLKMKGPASALTLPDHGSNNPSEKDMNMHRNSTNAPEINRRRFFFGAAAGAVAATAAMPVAAAEPEMSMREKAIWHLRELERMAFETGADNVFVTVMGVHCLADGGSNVESIMISTNGMMVGQGNMFEWEGGAL